ncbi:MAG: AAA family ATPase, partial [Bacteroidetes bacterium]
MTEETRRPEHEATATLHEDGQPREVAQKAFPKVLTILPLLQRPVFPGLTLPITFQGKDFLEAIRQVMENENGYVGLVFAHEEEGENGQVDYDYEEVGVIFQIYRVNQTGPDTVQVLGQAYARIIRQRVLLVQPTVRWEVAYHFDPEEKPDQELKAYMLAISADIKELLKLNPVLKEQVNLIMSQLDMERPGPTMDLISNLLSAEAEQLQELLETFDLKERARMLLKLLREELELSRLKQKIQKQIDEAVNKQQKEYFLREQLKAIKRELGMEKDEAETEIEKIRKKLEGKQLPEEAQKVVEEEMDKLRILNAQSPEFHVVRNYLDLIAELPWGITSEDNQDIRKAREILDRDHYGLEDVKERILEMLSIIVKRGTVSGTVICLVGPPGVGKTSVGKSIAEALGRKFFRFSVGGMVDEAEIKGHRRTYIGAMPGKLIQALKRVGTSNPVIMLDEIDKIGTSFRGDPASALLEVL